MDTPSLMKPRVALFALALMALLLAGCAGTTGPVIVATTLLSPACPSSLTDVRSGSRLSQLVPSSPEQAVFCKYAGMNEKVKSGTLVRIVVVRNPSTLAKLLNQLKPVPKDAVYPCPSDLGGRDAIVFAKAEKTTTVIIPTSGCPFVSSTNTAGRWFLSKAAYFELQKLDSATFR
jgi:hypothetical protein